MDFEGMADLNTWLADLVLRPQLQSVDVNPESPNLPLSVAMAWLQWPNACGRDGYGAIGRWGMH